MAVRFVLFAAGLFVALVSYDPLHAQAAGRDVAYWPFSSESPWNVSLGSGARYATIDSAGYSRTGGANLNVTAWSHPVYIASANDPITRFYRNDTGLIASMRAPSNAKPDAQADGSLIVVDATNTVFDHPVAVEMWRARRRGGAWRASATALHDLTGQGFYRRYVGVRAGGMSALGGLIRKHELEQARIPHALAIAVSPKALNRNVPGTGNAWTWPASWADGATRPGAIYGTRGNLYMGSLLAIPPSVDIEGLGLSEQGLAVARALQDYGAYIVESGSGNIIFYAEPASADVVASKLVNDLRTLARYLRVISNNTPQAVGGGGKRRRDPAPQPDNPDPVE